MSVLSDMGNRSLGDSGSKSKTNLGTFLAPMSSVTLARVPREAKAKNKNRPPRKDISNLGVFGVSLIFSSEMVMLAWRQSLPHCSGLKVFSVTVGGEEALNKFELMGSNSSPLNG